jgi:hypothetical protein
MEHPKERCTRGDPATALVDPRYVIHNLKHELQLCNASRVGEPTVQNNDHVAGGRHAQNPPHAPL